MIFLIGFSGGGAAISFRDAAKHATRDICEMASLMNTDGE
ncbi:hypothetical protein V7x_21260 [Crateriforma conspicua]|uniref:Uncharacterized protein n=1 Tax=Crateriforma conspicua TaxID=2527996 RepID=A0A5C6FUF6_9PLAN|nr:hypothetical protein V7x_21260 [Crateriforma conspicua]